MSLRLTTKLDIRSGFRYISELPKPCTKWTFQKYAHVFQRPSAHRQRHWMERPKVRPSACRRPGLTGRAASRGRAGGVEDCWNGLAAESAKGLFSAFGSLRQQHFRGAGSNGAPLDLEMSLVTEQPPPYAVLYDNFDPKTARHLVVPFADIGNARKQNGKRKRDWPFVEALAARSQMQSPIGSDAEIDIHCQVLMSPEIVNDTLPPFAVDHVRIKAPRTLGLKCSNPCDGLPTQRIDISVIRNLKRNLSTTLREHNPTP